MYKLEGDCAQVTARMEKDLARWKEGDLAFAQLQRIDRVFERVIYFGCLVPLLGLFLYGLNITPGASWQAALVFVAGAGGRLFIALKQSSVHPAAYDLELIESYQASWAG
jgi:hypothetical protein